eukprot:TRINITY_DN32815_c0_g1_i1.p1 TRINITY_DN32815_c0_g1~~TRINITY_DN32815_c0_g1_i1.p1  ORF type:complete len:100 (+),score=23.05 TRINITY_DN32815_c0_g1_i1:171-470(+)
MRSLLKPNKNYIPSSHLLESNTEVTDVEETDSEHQIYEDDVCYEMITLDDESKEVVHIPKKTLQTVIVTATDCVSLCLLFVEEIIGCLLYTSPSPRDQA